MARGTLESKPKVLASLASCRSGRDEVVDDAEGHGEPLELKWRVSIAEVAVRVMSSS